MQVLFARAIITSTSHANFVFLSSYRKHGSNLSARVFALGYFLNNVVCREHQERQEHPEHQVKEDQR